MPLFHPRVIKRNLDGAPTLTPEHAHILSSWSENVRNGLYDSETKNDGQFIESILVQLLGYKQSGTSPAAWTLVKNQPIASGNVDVAIGRFGPSAAPVVIAPFELKGAKTRDLDAIMPGRGKTPVQQAWEYAMDAKGAKWVLVSNFREIRLYAVGHGRKDYERFTLEDFSNLENYKKMMLLLSSEHLLGGKTATLLAESGLLEKEITDSFYSAYRGLRGDLIAQIQDANPTVPAVQIIGHSQTILDRVLFVAFAEDRGLLPKDTLKNTFHAGNPYAPQSVWTSFKGLFSAIDKGSSHLNIPGYNGGLFGANTELDALEVSDSLCEGFKKIGEYDFQSEVSVNILGHIFEQSITDIEEIKSAAVGESTPTTSARKKHGIYYTPPNITRYMVEQALGRWLADRKDEIGFNKLPDLLDEDYASIAITKGGKKAGRLQGNSKIEAHFTAWSAYDNVLRKVRVLDPACGSGAFLNEVYDYLYREGQVVNSQLTILRRGQQHLFRWDTHILKENLFGVDLNPESVEITKLSLWLKTANRGEKLTHLDGNIRCGNSLVDDPVVAGGAAFTWWDAFPGAASDGGFDVIIGNPPYVLSRDNVLDDMKEYAKKHYSLFTEKPNLYLLFIERSLNLLKPGGHISLIVPNSLLGVESAAKCRQHLASETELSSVVNLLGSTFKDASVEAAVFCSKKSPPPNDHQVSVGSIRDLGELEAPLKKVPQANWLKSKTAVFDLRSDADDRSLIAKLSALPKLSDFYRVSCGLQAYEKGKGNPKQTALDVKNHPFDFTHQFDSTTFRYLNGSDVGRFHLAWGGTWLRWGPWLSQPRDMSLFTGPRVLIREITGTYPRLVLSTYVEDQFLNNKSILNVLPLNDSSEMKYLVGILNSKLISFFHSRCAVKSDRLTFPKAVAADIANYPVLIPDQATITAVSTKVDLLIALNDKLKGLRHSFCSLFQADFGLKSMPRKLDEWPNLEFGELMAISKPGKGGISLSKKSEWLKHHSDRSAEAIAIQNAIEASESFIDQAVAAIYGLTPEEVSAISDTPV